MKKVKVRVSFHQIDGEYWVFGLGQEERFGVVLYGTGKTLEEAREDFLRSFEEVKEMVKEDSYILELVEKDTESRAEASNLTQREN